MVGEITLQADRCSVGIKSKVKFKSVAGSTPAGVIFL